MLCTHKLPTAATGTVLHYPPGERPRRGRGRCEGCRGRARAGLRQGVRRRGRGRGGEWDFGVRVYACVCMLHVHWVPKSMLPIPGMAAFMLMRWNGGILLFGCWWGYSSARGRGSGGGISLSLVPLNAFLEA